jgi:hypothetical protein
MLDLGRSEENSGQVSPSYLSQRSLHRNRRSNVPLERVL